MDFTPAQHRAIYTHDRNLIVVAGAGSGKTSVLVNRYLALLDAHPDWPLNALVAITFTQKAAGEMRDRVRQALEDRLVNARDSDEAGVWARRLAEMDSARIDTIHALCAAILRANAADAALDPDFAVLDEVDARILLENVLDDVFRQIVANDDPALRLFTEYDSRAIRETLREFASANLPALPDNLFNAWAEQWQFDTAQALTSLLDNAEFQAAANWTPATGWPGEDKMLVVWQACSPCLETLWGAETTLETRLSALADLSGAINLQGGKQGAWGGADGLAACKAALRLLRERADGLLKRVGEPPGELDRRAADLLPLWASLLRRVQTAYQQAKMLGSMLDFDDLEHRTRDLLLLPAVRARYVGQEFRQVLVDEFQDTNEAQWDIVQALADPLRPGSLFVVGDARQSIYGFRGADVSVFDRVRHELAEVGGEEVTLSESFRTHETLVAAFNMLFHRLLRRDEDGPARAYQVELGDAMRAVRHEAPGEGSFVELLLVDRDASEDDEHLTAEDHRRREAAGLAQRLQRMVEDGRLIYDRQRGHLRVMGYGDVALLFQSMSNVTLYEDVLKAAGIPFVTVAGRGYYDRQEVWDLINLLRALYNLADNLALASVLRSPLFSLSDDALLALRLLRDAFGRTPPLFDALTQAATRDIPGIEGDDVGRVMFAWDCLAELAALAGRVTIAELLRLALDRTGYLATLTSLPDGARRRGNVEKLLEKAQGSGKITLGAFSQYLNDLTTYEVREGEALLESEGAVTLMTVHKSKGLEFPVVVLVDASWKGVSTDRALLSLDRQFGLSCKVPDRATNKLERPYAQRRADHLRQGREDAERRRLLYVAATRAQDYLVIGGQVKRHKQTGRMSGDGWLGWLLEAFELQEPEPLPEFYREYDWGLVRVAVTGKDAPDIALIDPDAPTAWDSPEIRAGQPFDDAPTATPALLVEPPFSRGALARELTATQIGDLGGVFLPDDGALYKRRLRRSLFHDAPAVIETVTAQARRVSSRRVGGIVHRALRAWSLYDANLPALLRNYAWEEGIVDPGQQQYAVQQALKLLERVAQSDVVAWLESAAEVYRDVPFAFSHQGRAVHGTIDVVFQRDDGSWALVDYKTTVAADEVALHDHVRRYHMQVGMYAAALREQLRAVSLTEIAPDVYIHYINHVRTIAIARDEWESALARLEDHVADVVGLPL